MYAQNLPVDNESEAVELRERTTYVGSASSIVKKILEKVRIKPKPPQTIHSGTISEDERHSALAPFTMTGIDIGQVNRDYNAFFKTAWGSSPTSLPKTSAANVPQLHPQAVREQKEEKVGYHRAIVS